MAIPVSNITVVWDIVKSPAIKAAEIRSRLVGTNAWTEQAANADPNAGTFTFTANAPNSDVEVQLRYRMVTGAVSPWIDMVTHTSAAIVQYTTVAGTPTSLSQVNSTEGSKLTGIAAGATVGAIAGTNLQDGSGNTLTAGQIVTSVGTSADTSKVNGVAASTITANLSTSYGAITDTTPPDVPTNLAMTSTVAADSLGNQIVTLTVTWRASTASDTAGYILSLATNGGGYIDNDVGNVTTWTATLPANTSVSAKVAAYDRNTNKSAYSSVVSTTTTKDTTPPAIATNLSATTLGLSGITVSWTNPADSDLSKALVYESSTNNTASTTLVSTVNASAGGTSSTTLTRTTGATFYYWVKTQDTSGNLSGFSASAQGTVASVTNANLTPGLVAPSTVASLPSASGYTGPALVFNQADGKLYRYVNGAFTAAVGGTDIVASTIPNSAFASSNLSSLSATDAIKNTLVNIDANGNLQGIGTGAGSTVANTAITLSGGALQGIGTGAGTVVDNTKVAISAAGQLTGAGGGQVTIAGLGYLGALNATADMRLTPIGTATITGNTIKSNTSADGGDGGQTVEKILGGVQTGCIVAALGTYMQLVGSGGQVYECNIGGDGNVRCYTAQGNYGYTIVGTAAVGDSFALVQDETKVQIWKNGAVLYTRADLPTRQQTWFAKFTCYSYVTIGGVYFRAFTDNAWSSVGGVNKPADNATDGAVAGVNLKDSSGTTLSDSAVKNSAITIGANGALTGAGGGSVTITGLGYTGALNATVGDNLLINPSLANGATGWNQNSSVVVTAGTTGDPVSRYFAVSAANQSVGAPYAQIPAGSRRLYVTYWLYRSDNQQITNDMTFLDANNNYLGFLRINDFGNTAVGSWAQVRYTFDGLPDRTAQFAFGNVLTAAGPTKLGGYHVGLSQMGSDITALDPKVGSLDYGAAKGDNLIINADLRDNLNNWYISGTPPVRTAGGNGDPVYFWRATNANSAVFANNSNNPANFPLEASKRYYVSGKYRCSATSLGMQPTFYAYNVSIGYLGGSAPVFYPTVANTWTDFSFYYDVPAGAAFGYLSFSMYASAGGTVDVANCRCAVTQYGATLGAPSGTMVGSTLAQTVEARANDPATQVNAGTTTISGGKITTGSIQAQQIAAAAITADKLTIGNRGVSLEGVTFQVVGNTLSWTSGYAVYINDGGNTAAQQINAGSTTTAGYVFWNSGSNTLNAGVGYNAYSYNTGVVVAIWDGTFKVVTNYGTTIIDGSRITTGSIQATQIAAATITGNLIAGNTIVANNIASGAISTSKLLVTNNGSALNADPNCADATAWQLWSGNAPIFATVTDGQTGNTVMRSAGAGALTWNYGTDRIAVDPTKTYRMRCYVRTISGSGSVLYAGAALFDAYGANISGNGSQWFYGAASGTGVGTTWTLFSASFGANTATPIPSNGRTMSPLMILSYGGGSSVIEAQDIRIEEVLGSTLIQDGAIITSKIAAGAVTANAIAAGTITAAQIAAATITGNQIAANSITAGALVAGTITADKIAGGTITGDKISTSTSLPASITVGNTGVSIATIQSQASNPASVVNANSTQINPGNILIAGGTTLANWRNGGDNTKIEGGSIATNTIAANKLTVGNRNVQLLGITFSNDLGNVISWTAGYVDWYDENYNRQVTPIRAGSCSRTSQGGNVSGVAYVWFDRVSSSQNNVFYGGETDPGTVMSNPNNVIVASYFGGNNMNSNFGQTIIDGSGIRTGSITADRISVGSLSAISANVGLVTAGQIRSNNGATILNMDGSSFIFEAANFQIQVPGVSINPPFSFQSGALTLTNVQINGGNINGATINTAQMVDNSISRTVIVSMNGNTLTGNGFSGNSGSSGSTGSGGSTSGSGSGNGKSGASIP